MDSLLANLKANGTINTRTGRTGMVVEIGNRPVPVTGASPADMAKAKEAAEAVIKLGESRPIDYFAGVSDVEYSLVS